MSDMKAKAKVKTKRDEMRSKRRQRERRQRLLVFAVVAGVALILVMLAAGPAIMDALAPVGEITEVEPVARPQADFNTMGDPNAPVKIVEYSNFLCSFCGKFAEETEPRIVENYVETGTVHFEYVTWTANNPESQNMGEAAYCAGDQGKFWEYHDIVFANTDGKTVGYFSDKRLAALAEAVDLNMDEFEACYDSNKYSSLITEDFNEGIAAGITATPSFLINGKLVEGAQDYSVFQQEIETALAAAGQ